MTWVMRLHWEGFVDARPLASCVKFNDSLIDMHIAHKPPFFSLWLSLSLSSFIPVKRIYFKNADTVSKWCDKTEARKKKLKIERSRGKKNLQARNKLHTKLLSIILVYLSWCRSSRLALASDWIALCRHHAHQICSK